MNYANIFVEKCEQGLFFAPKNLHISKKCTTFAPEMLRKNIAPLMQTVNTKEKIDVFVKDVTSSK